MFRLVFLAQGAAALEDWCHFWNSVQPHHPPQGGDVHGLQEGEETYELVVLVWAAGEWKVGEWEVEVLRVGE